MYLINEVCSSRWSAALIKCLDKKIKDERWKIVKNHETFDLSKN